MKQKLEPGEKCPKHCYLPQATAVSSEPTTSSVVGTELLALVIRRAQVNSIGVSEATSPLRNLLMWNVGSECVLPPCLRCHHRQSSTVFPLHQQPYVIKFHTHTPRHVLNNAGTSSSPAAPFLLVVAFSQPHHCLHNCEQICKAATGTDI